MTDNGSVQISGAVNHPTASADGKYVYVLEKGDGPRKLHVFSTADRREVKAIDVGENPQFNAKDDKSDRIFILSDGAPDANPRRGALFVLRGTDAQRIDMDFKPLTARLSDDRRSAYVVGSLFRGLRDAGRIVKIDLQRNSTGNPINVMRGAIDFLISPDGSRAFISYVNYRTVVDLQNEKQLTSFMTGSKGARFGQALLAAGATVASYQAGRSAAQASGKSSFSYSVYTPKVQAATRGPLAVRGDGKFAYALDSQTSYVTVADAATGERVDNIRIGGGAQELVPLGAGRFIAAVSESSVSIIDTQSNSKTGDVSLPGEIRDFVIAPNGEVAVALAKEKLVAIDSATGKIATEMSGVKRPLQVLFAP